jgi:hypothetical protein
MSIRKEGGGLGIPSGGVYRKLEKGRVEIESLAKPF